MIPPCPQGWTHTDNLLPLPSCAQVGAVSIRATLNCEAFADAHRASAHYDQSSFVGLAWRPEGESCCVGTLAHTFFNTARMLTVRLLLVYVRRGLQHWESKVRC